MESEVINFMNLVYNCHALLACTITNKIVAQMITGI